MVTTGHGTGLEKTLLNHRDCAIECTDIESHIAGAVIASNSLQ